MRHILTIILLLALCGPAHAADGMFSFGFKWQGGGAKNMPFSIFPLSTGIGAARGSGGTFTRNSVQWYQPAGSTTWTSASANVAAFEGGGYLSEPASTNKVTAYSVIPADTLGTELASGTVTVGQKYQITAQNTVDFTTVGAANNTVGTQFVATAATITLDATNKVKRVQWGVGEKSFHNGTAFVQNITGMSLSGDVAATLSVVDDTAALTAAGLQTIAGTKVYKLDNSAGSATSWVTIAGASGNTNNHSLFVYSRVPVGGSARVDFNDVAQVTFTNEAYSKQTKESVAATGAGSVVAVTCLAGKTAYFILPQLEERATVTSPMVTQGSTTTRAATVLSYPISNLPTSGPWAVKLAFTPKMAGSASTAVRTLWSSYKDASNWVSLNYNGVVLYAEINKAGTKEYVTKPLTTVAGTTYNIVLKQEGGRFFIFAQAAKGSDGLGAELNAETTFDAPASWTTSHASITVAGGVGVFTATPAFNIIRRSGAPIGVVGKAYKAQFDVKTADTIRFAINGLPSENKGVGDNYTVSGISSATALAIINPVDGTGTVDNFSVKEIYNSTTSAAFTLGTTFEVGSFNGTQQAQANFSNLTIYGNLGDSKAISLATP